MELGPSSVSANCAVTQDLSRVLWNTKGGYHARKSNTLFHILSKINPDSITQ